MCATNCSGRRRKSGAKLFPSANSFKSRASPFGSSACSSGTRASRIASCANSRRTNRKRRPARGGVGTNNIADPRLSTLNIKVADIELLEPALQQARNVLMHTHKCIEDFSFQTQENWSEQIVTSIRNQRMSGGFISAISLLVGGIGIMNIMLASITERIREIGIRKAVGATFTNVFTQIIVESVVI